MVTQKAISLKIHKDLLEDLDREVSNGWRKRNTLINDAVRYYLALQDARRLYKYFNGSPTRKHVFNEFLKEQFPEAATW